MTLSDIGILIELIGFGILISPQIPRVKRLRKRDKTKVIYDALFPGGIVIVIVGLFLQFSFLLPVQDLNNNQEFPDAGDFVFEKQSYSNSNYPAINNVVSVFENRLPPYLNKHFNLPNDVFIVFERCGVANAYYDHSNDKIIYCYELLEKSFDLVREVTNSTLLHYGEKGEMVTGITFFFLYHELGHVLIDVYDLPVLGKQEDAADFFAILIILNIMENLEGPSYGLAGIMTLFDEDSKIYQYTSDLKFWDSHSLDQQRLYYILCSVYEKHGPNAFPEGFDGSKTHERLKECKFGVDDISESWATLLKPHLKSDSDFLREID